ncbi:hypothetical protein K353_05830 [Kitasatospora sp. SolWspMP-SS2h]|uniref:hypothetical protein n=1 Tax=Kitasatospora sp. SolWspMP-SS2h TaxID=1305729 RepID=UPI000DB8F952|nr:hypothetical protein [Kitasatospora sp. SolWspMP-SS2h]RAJ32832.1 hypothetical protein K353_05830 [Kitasatospora sp. SolWspMP-SS2h]
MPKTAAASVSNARRPGPDGRYPAYRGHICQPYTGHEDFPHAEDLVDDPDFRLTFKRNPWCWSPEPGFHRTRTPHISQRLTGLTNGKFVGPSGLNMRQAVRLRAGWGTCDGGGPDPARGKEQTWRVMVAVDYRWGGDLEPVAYLGQLIGILVDGGGQQRIGDDDALLRGGFRDSTRTFLPHPIIGDEWNAVLLRVCERRADLERDGAWVRAQVPVPVPRRRGEPERWEYRVDLWNNLVGVAAHPGGMRIVSEVYELTQPAPEQAVVWMTPFGTPCAGARSTLTTGCARRPTAKTRTAEVRVQRAGPGADLPGPAWSPLERAGVPVREHRAKPLRGLLGPALALGGVPQVVLGPLKQPGARVPEHAPALWVPSRTWLRVGNAPRTSRTT